ncbi:hypothetical protein [Endozoicomonas sp. ALC066]|uniref:hypothetical protein n=1 Tax=Endozoicomonas sp. ALC066 TaxID=3403078 RepID=UPI003BB580D2
MKIIKIRKTKKTPSVMTILRKKKEAAFKYALDVSKTLGTAGMTYYMFGLALEQEAEATIKLASYQTIGLIGVVLVLLGFWIMLYKTEED